MVYIIIIHFKINVFVFFSFITYFIIFLQGDIIHCMINNSIVFFM